MNSKTQQQLLLKQLPVWRLWVPLLLQAGLILATPAQSIYIQITGKTVILQTLPVYLYDFLQGYSQTLSYDISGIERLQKLPGWNELESSYSPVPSKYLPADMKFYVVMEAPTSQLNLPLAWKPVRVSQYLPANLPANQIAVMGRTTGDMFVRYGIERYYIPESQQNKINQNISQAQRGKQQTIVVEAKVAQGKVVPMSFWVRDRNYRF